MLRVRGQDLEGMFGSADLPPGARPNLVKPAGFSAN
jgi:hypothetical protein